MNDETQTRWTSISWQALLILNRLRSQQLIKEYLDASEEDADDRDKAEHKAPSSNLTVFA